MDQLITKQKYSIDVSQVDFMGRYQLCYLFQDFADIATFNAEKLGMWSQDMMDQYGWIIAKQTLKLDQPIMLNDEIEIRTTIDNGSFVAFPRYYFLYKDNKEIGRCSSTWTVIDIQKRRIVSPKRIGIQVPKVFHDIHLDTPKTICIDIPMTYICDRQVLYSDVDTNQHMNNTRYIQWAFDILDYNIHKDYFVHEISINYKKEIRPLQYVSLYLGHQDSRYIIEGRNNDDVYFVIELYMKEKKTL